MQARSKIYKIFVVALIASLVLGACGGGTSGSTWFNLPSIGINVQEDGSVSTFGLNLGPVLPPTLVPQLAAANVKKLEVRAGYNGIHVYANGVDLPYLSWDADAVSTLQNVVRTMPGIPNANLIADLLPWLRTIGVGVAVNLPGGGDVGPRWQGETAVTSETADAPIGPFAIRSVALDDSGNLSVGSVPASALGLNAPVLDAGTLGLLKSLGIEQLDIKTMPNGIELSLGDKKLPGIAYDSKSLSGGAADHCRLCARSRPHARIGDAALATGAVGCSSFADWSTHGRDIARASARRAQRRRHGRSLWL